MSAVLESPVAGPSEIPAPLVFTDSAADKVRDLVSQEEGNPEPEAARIRAGRRLLGLPVRLHFR